MLGSPSINHFSRLRENRLLVVPPTLRRAVHDLAVVIVLARFHRTPGVKHWGFKQQGWYFMGVTMEFYDIDMI